MKQKIYTKHANHTLHALMMALLLLWCGVSIASAQGSGTKEDPYTLTAGGEYDAPNYLLYGKFTAPSDGVLSIAWNYTLYTDETFTNELETQPSWNGVYPQAYKVKCTSGTTYYLGGTTSATKIKINFLTEAERLELTSCSPKNGSVFDTSAGIVNLAFNQKVSISGCVMTIGNKTHNPTVYVNNAYASVDIKNILVEAYNDGSLKEGDDITLKFSGIKALEDDNMLLGEDGTFEVTYKAAPKPLMLLSTTNTPASAHPVNDFKSYYMTGDDTGIVTLTFSDAVGSVNSVMLQYGSPEPNASGESEYYEETLDPQIQGNTITLNLKGKLRRPEDMLPGVNNKYSFIALAITGVKDASGNYACSTGQGTIGSYGFNYNYNNVSYIVTTDWTVIDGEAINSDTKNVELWLKEDGGKATFTGAKFAYKDKGTDKTAFVNAQSFTTETDPTDAAAQIITIPAPNVNMDADSKVTVSLAEVETPSGVVSENFSHEFNCTGRTVATADLQITSAVLHAADGDVNIVNGAIGTIAKETKATINLNREVGYITWEITEPELGSLYLGYGNYENASSLDIEFRGALKFLAGKTYTFTMKAWNNETESNGNAAPTVGTATFTFTGTELPYVYSDVELINNIANPFQLTSEEQNTYVLSFTAPANVKKAIVNLGMGMSQDCEVVADDSKKEWTVTLPAYVLNNYDNFDLNVFAEDLEGRAINKAPDAEPMGSEDNTWFTITFQCNFNKPDFTVTPASESTLESIDKITFYYNNGISVNWNNTEKITVLNKSTREVVAEFTGDNVLSPEDFFDNTNVRIEFAEPITAAGTYEVTVPAGFFILGEEYENQTSKLTTIYYEVKATSEPGNGFNVTFDPAGGNVTEIPAVIKLTVTNRDLIGPNGMNPTLTDAAGNNYPVTLDINWDWEDLNCLAVNLKDGAITAEGTYTLTIPAGAITADDDPDNINTEDIVVTYIIGTGDGIDNIISNAGGKVDVYTVNGVNVLRNADAAAVKALGKGLYIINGKKVVIK